MTSYDPLRKQDAGTTFRDEMQLLQLQQWLTPHMWSLQTLNANPYDYNPAGALTCHGGVGFRIEWGAYAACAPCDALTMQTSDTCAVMKDAVSTFSGCSGTTPDTVQTVCGSCKAFAGSNLIPKNNVDGNPNAAYLAFPLPSLTTGSQLRFVAVYPKSLTTRLPLVPLQPPLQLLGAQRLGFAQ